MDERIRKLYPAEDKYHKIHVIRRNGKHEFRCAYNSLGYLLGNEPQDSFTSVDDAVQHLVTHLAKRGIIGREQSRRDSSSGIPFPTSDDAMTYWIARTEEIAEMQDETLYIDIDCFSKTVEHITRKEVAKHIYCLHDYEQNALLGTRHYLIGERDIPIQKRVPLNDNTFYLLGMCVERLTGLGISDIPTSPDLSQKEVLALMSTYLYVELLHETYR